MRVSSICKVFVLPLTALCLISCSAIRNSGEGVRIASDGHPLATIVVGTAPIPAEETACRELANYLHKITGATFTVAKETDVKDLAGSAIYVGRTAFATKNGVDFASLDGEEWVIKTVGTNLILAGGRPRGSLYSVYEFLESQIGVHWLDWDCEIVPSKPTLEFGSIDLSGSPAFPLFRDIYTAFWLKKLSDADKEKQTMVRARNRQLVYNSKLGGHPKVMPCASHTLYEYVSPAQWFKSNPEYFSMNRKGKRSCGTGVPGSSGSQLCFTNQDVQKLVVKRLREMIKENDRDAEAKGLDKPRLYEFSVEDNYSFGLLCYCPTCKEVSEREGDIGPLIECLNYVSDEISKDYPDIKLRTLAYVATEIPPKTIVPRKNVIVEYADLYSMSDCFRPLEHSINKGQAEKLRKWGGIANKHGFPLAIWDYWFPGDGKNTASCPGVVPADTIAKDFQFFRNNGVKGIFAETHGYDASFYELQCWVGYQLCYNPDLATERLVDIFMNGYYGAAAVPMRKYYVMLAQAVEAEPLNMRTDGPGRPAYRRSYFTASFLKNCRDQIKAAEALCLPDTKEQIRVWRELAMIDRCILAFWDKLSESVGGAMPFSRQELADEYLKTGTAVIRYDYGSSLQGEKLSSLTCEHKILEKGLPVPEQFRSHPTGSVLVLSVKQISLTKLAEDTEACINTAMKLDDFNDEVLKKQTPPLLYVSQREVCKKNNFIKRVIDDYPDDEKYHVYKIGTFSLGPCSQVTMGLEVWKVPNRAAVLDKFYQFDDGMEKDPNLWDIYASVKVTGPAYVKGSVKENAFWMDQVILVRPDAIHEKNNVSDK